MKLLSITIPTYNRAPFLKESLTKLLPQMKGYEDKIDLLVSNNNSTDNTEEVVKEFIAQGAPIRYNRNATNLGMDGNFIYCLRHAQGEYSWILGDDDHLLNGVLPRLIAILEQGRYGVVHMKMRGTAGESTVYDNAAQFFRDTSYWLMFISSNIVRSEYTKSTDMERYRGTFFTFFPVYLNAMAQERENVVVRFPTMTPLLNVETNGGYHIFEVFAIHYLNIVKEYRHAIGCGGYEHEKYVFCKNHLYYWLVQLISNPNHGLRYETKRWLRLIMTKYWYEPYIYLLLAKVGIKRLGNTALGSRLKKR